MNILSCIYGIRHREDEIRQLADGLERMLRDNGKARNLSYGGVQREANRRREDVLMGITDG